MKSEKLPIMESEDRLCRVNPAEPEIKSGVGLVLAGGGTKGAYEIGAWQALQEAGVMDQITGFSGSSIGAFNTALFAKGDLKTAEDIWKNMSMADFADVNVDLIRQKFADAEGHTPSEVLEQNIRIKYASERAVRKAGDTMSYHLNRKIAKAAQKIAETPDKNSGDEIEIGADGVAEISPDALQYNSHKGRNFMVWCLQNLFGSGYAKPDRLRAILEQLDFSQERLNGLDLYTTVCEWDTEHDVSGNVQYISWRGKSREEILDLIVASASLPVLYPQRHKDGKTYVDGGYADNEPIKPLYDAGYRRIFIIYLDKYKGKKLRKIVEEQERVFPGCEFVRLIPGRKFNDGFVKSCIISDKMTEDRMKAGYEDCRKLLKQI